MGFGGSVQAMIDSLRTNRRTRPSLRKNFHREAPRYKLSIENRIIKNPSVADQKRIREKLVYYKTERRKRVFKQIIISVLIMIFLVFMARYVISILQESPDYFFRGYKKTKFFG